MRYVSDFEINVKRDDLLGKLKENMAKHFDIYQEAVVEYKRQCIDAIETRLNNLKIEWGDNYPKTWMKFDLECPKCYVEVYKQMIGMLEMCVDKQLKISGTQYRQWVEDKWDWKDEFDRVSSSYIVGK